MRKTAPRPSVAAEPPSFDVISNQLDKVVTQLYEWTHMVKREGGSAWPQKRIPDEEYLRLIRLGNGLLAQYEKITKL